MDKLQQAADLGQSIWLDYLDRSFIKSGKLKDFIGQGICGITSNPSIFQKAITSGGDYDTEIAQLTDDGKTVQEIYETLAIADIQHVADLLLPVYTKAGKQDGFISLAVRHRLAHLGTCW